VLIGLSKHACPAARPSPFAFARALRLCQLVEGVIDLLVRLSSRNRNRPGHTVSSHTFVARSHTATIMEDKVHRLEPLDFSCGVEGLAEGNEAKPVKLNGRYTDSGPRQRPTMDAG